jgi:signal transduction histidine kinase
VGLENPLWRSVAVFRVIALIYATALLVANFRDYAHPAGGGVVLGAMALWTALAGYAYAIPAWRRWPLLGTDLVVTAGCLLASRWVVTPDALSRGASSVPMAWIAGPVLAWAVCGGRRRGAIAALVMGGIDLLIRGSLTSVTVNGTVLLLLAGIAVGHVARLAVDAEHRLQHAVEMEAATRERERLARGIHDSVLQVLALVQRRGAELGGGAAELGRLAGEQEATLRALIAADAADIGTGSGGFVDLRTLVSRHASASVSIATPATTVLLPRRVANEVTAAVSSALDNIKVHCGESVRGWVLVEEEAQAVTVTIRDDGPGIEPGRLAEAEAAGRLGIAQSIRGRIRDLGGTMTITTAPGQGTEVELRIPADGLG